MPKNQIGRPPDHPRTPDGSIHHPDPFALRLLAWWDAHGRKDLPWQRDRTPYRVWVSEIMLQQTQVATVLPYYARFMHRFPDVAALGTAAIDDVLHLWTGLGYYARGRNLHRAAQVVLERHAGEVPSDPMALLELPGIGRSTANAIHALAADGRSPILDGNVKRVLTRWRGIDGWPQASATEAALWNLATDLLPATRMADYTQAVMDLGATLCTRSRPRCDACPLREDCVARATSRTTTLPIARPRRALPERRTRMWVIASDAGVLLQLRPPSGLWGGLWSFPETTCDSNESTPQQLEDVLVRTGLRPWLVPELNVAWGSGEPGGSHGHVRPADSVLAIEASVPEGLKARAIEALPGFAHQFTHFRLLVHPMLVRLDASPPLAGVAEAPQVMWYREDSQEVGLSAVVTRVLGLVRSLHGLAALERPADGDHR